MPLSVYNSLTRKKEPFIPQTPKQVKFYVCGVTVYDYCHIGHARVYVVFDALRHYLESLGYSVTYIQNFTDIDDKIIARSIEENCDINTLTTRYIEAYFEDMDFLSIKRATQYPRATEHIAEIIALIETLISKGFAYNKNGNVFFSVKKHEHYGALSRKVLEDLDPGHRVSISEDKNHPLDFALWKKSKKNEPVWDSPWGLGRPGWHIECSAMSLKTLGDTLDIHAGGVDLMFPHHENEIAQSECATGHLFSKYWLHNGFVTIKEEKMSKSLKNFTTIKELRSEFSGDVLRFFLLKSHYRSPLSFSREGVIEAKQALARLQNTCSNITKKDPSNEKIETFQTLEQSFFTALDDDFNTAEAIGYLFELNKVVNTTKSGSGVIEKLMALLGLNTKLKRTDTWSPEILALVTERQEARKKKDFALSDSIRDRLKNDYQVIIEDHPNGPKLAKDK